MTTFRSSTFTTKEKRPKTITYGRSSRLPPQRPNFLEEDAPSSERLHKQTATSNGPTAEPGGLLKISQSPGNARAATTSPDVFDVPSEDELGSQSIIPAKRLAVHRSKTERGSRTNTAKREALTSSRPATAASRPSKQSGLANPTETTNRDFHEQIRPQNPAGIQAPTSALPSTTTTLQKKVLQSTDSQKQATTSRQRLQRSSISSKSASRATTPALSVQTGPKSQSVVRNASTASTRKATNPLVKQPASLDVFDLPSSDEEVPLPISKAPQQHPHQIFKGTTKQLGASRVPSLNVPQKVPAKPNELGATQSRKRKGSFSSITVPKQVTGRVQKPLTAQRDHKVRKRENETSTDHKPVKAVIPHSVPHATVVEAPINKPRRTRTRTVPVLGQLATSKGQSSPMKSSKTIPIDQSPKAPTRDVAAEIPASDDTMYDILDSITTPVRPMSLRGPATCTPGSVTPRQKDLFSTLLKGSAASKTPSSALASLQLSVKKPRSLLGALARSKSDLTHSSQVRKTRLIDTLKDEETSSEDDGSESDEEAEGTSIANKDRTPVQAKHTISDRSTGDVDMDETAAADSQTSQVTSGQAIRPKLTYAAQRSYLQEANPEDEFLVSMDLDDSWKMDSQTVSTDDEDAPTSQVRTHHELKKFGQNTMFSWDMEESVCEISVDSSKSTRRSAMMELCTKMADPGFVSQLLDSGFTHKLLENMVSTNDVIFDFVAAASVLFVLQTKPAFAVVDQMYQSSVKATLMNLVDNDADILNIVRDRKVNMSKIAQESSLDFRALVLAAKVWSSDKPGKASPQLLALKTIDLLIRGLRESGNTESLLSPVDVSRLVNICSTPSSRIRAAKASSQDSLVLDLAISTLEAVSIANQDHLTWPTKILQQLAEIIPVFLEENGLSRAVEAMKLCMNLTNNRPKACRSFSTQAFIQPLVQFIVSRFDLLHAGKLDTERRARVLAALTLGLGAMINLAELSDQARLNTIDGSNSIEVLVKTFLVGSDRAAEADSVEESEFSVQIGFLTVLLGNLCLNNTIRAKVRASLPGQQLHLLLDKMKEFARIHEHVDKKTASRFEGPEGREALNNYYIRIMHVVKKLEGAKE